MSKKEPRSDWRIVIYFAIGVVLLWTLAVPITAAFLGWPKSSGEAGDTFGTVNALFSALSFLGVIVAILLQRDELRLQRTELKESREVMKQSAEAQDRSQVALGKQFRMLSLTARIHALTTLLDAAERDKVEKSHTDATLGRRQHLVEALDQALEEIRAEG